MSEHVIFALHGFLGQSSDWNQIKQALSSRSDFVAVDLFSEESPDIDELEDYAEELSNEVDEIVEGKKKKIFIGYSLGGRIGLHLMQNNPDQFDHYIFISTNPGLTETEASEKNQRLIADMKWSSLISESNWSEFLKSWNQQPVFAGSTNEIERHLGDYDINKLKRAMVMWTLAQQDDFRPLIQEFNDKITWIVGEKDSKYLNLAESMKQKKILLDYKRISSGHRILLDQPKFISDLLVDLLK